MPKASSSRFKTGFQGPLRVSAPARDGFGYYGIFGVEFRVGQGANVPLRSGDKGLSRAYFGRPLGATPAGETKDRWLNVFGIFSFNF